MKLFAAILALLSVASSVRFRWDPSSEPDVVRYRLHYGPAVRTYTNSMEFTGRTTTAGMVYGLTPGATYHFAVIAENATAASEPSDEVVVTIGTNVPAKPTPGPVLVNSALQAAATVTGPWTNLAEFPAVNLGDYADVKFFRVFLQLTDP